MTEARVPYQITRAATSKPHDDQQTERLVIHCTPETLAKLKDIEQQYHQQFKRDFIAGADQAGFTITGEHLTRWLQETENT